LYFDFRREKEKEIKTSSRSFKIEFFLIICKDDSFPLSSLKSISGLSSSSNFKEKKVKKIQK